MQNELRPVAQDVLLPFGAHSATALMKWENIKAELDSISHVEPFVESLPQVCILWMYLGLTGQWFCSWWLGVKFWISAISATLGIFKFLNEGPFSFDSAIGAFFVALAASSKDILSQSCMKVRPIFSSMEQNWRIID